MPARIIPLILLLACACAPRRTPCVSPNQCPEGQECLANRCAALGGDPVQADSTRQVAELVDLAIVAERFDFGTTLPQELTVGAKRFGTTLVLMRFEPVWQHIPAISEAFLLVDTLPGGRGSTHDVEVELWRVESDWSARELSWRAQPSLAHPSARAIARSGPAPLRMDVTHLVRYLKQHPRADHGLALRASAGRGAGVRLASGLGGGHPPRLEIYHGGGVAAPSAPRSEQSR